MIFTREDGVHVTLNANILVCLANKADNSISQFTSGLKFDGKSLIYCRHFFPTTKGYTPIDIYLTNEMFFSSVGNDNLLVFARVIRILNAVLRLLSLRFFPVCLFIYSFIYMR